MKHTFRNIRGVREYTDTIRLAINTRCDVSVREHERKDGSIHLTLSDRPTDADKREMADIVATTGRAVSFTDDTALVESDNGRPLLENLARCLCSETDVGKSVGELSAEEFSIDTISAGYEVELPDGASNQDVNRLKNVMLAAGKTAVEHEDV